jgi:hypothetical protein
MMSEWQPIETAPRDETYILGYADGEMTVVHWRDYDGEGCWQLAVSGLHADDGEWWPTHWMPLPKPPKTESL